MCFSRAAVGEWAAPERHVHLVWQTGRPSVWADCMDRRTDYVTRMGLHNCQTMYVLPDFVQHLRLVVHYFGYPIRTQISVVEVVEGCLYHRVMKLLC